MIRKIAVILFAGLWLLYRLVQAAELTGRQITEKLKENRTVKNEIGSKIRLLVDKDGNQEKR